MNLMHFKYAVVIAETKSMTKAAERLFTAQPNLSRAIKELENELGITLFKRTPQGIFPTPQGEEFLGYARNILSQVNAIENIRECGKEQASRFSLSAPVAAYIESAFVNFCKRIEAASLTDTVFTESSQSQTIKNVADSGYGLGIVRYRLSHEQSLKAQLKEKSLLFEKIYEFEPIVIMSSAHPLAERSSINQKDLNAYTEILIGRDALPQPGTTPEDADTSQAKQVIVPNFSAAVSLLNHIRGSFMISSPLRPDTLYKHNLCQCAYASEDNRYCDMLIYKSGYRQSAADKAFLDELLKATVTNLAND